MIGHPLGVTLTERLVGVAESGQCKCWTGNWREKSGAERGKAEQSMAEQNVEQGSAWLDKTGVRTRQRKARRGRTHWTRRAKQRRQDRTDGARQDVGTVDSVSKPNAHYTFYELYE